jgi:hypothetical protein
MSKNQFRGLAYTKNVDALNYAPSNRSKGSLLRREEGGEVCEADASGGPGKGCRRKSKSRSRGSSSETRGGVLSAIGTGIAAGLGGLLYKNMKGKE